MRRVAAPDQLVVEDAATDPLTVEYCLSKRGYAVFDIAIRHARAFHSMGLSLDARSHPFSRAFAHALVASDAPSARRAIERELRCYYDEVQPKSALDVVDLTAAEAPGLAGQPGFNYLAPWWEKGVEETSRGREKALRYIGMRYGLGPAANAGHPFFGPLQDSRLNLQIERMDRLLRSYRREGFKPFARDFPIKVTALRRQGEYRWFIEEGQHRFALACALGEERMRAMVISVVRREDAALWPQVVSGEFSEDGALSHFDRIFDSRAPAICSSWINRQELRSDGA
jgi:hypothetical protein